MPMIMTKRIILLLAALALLAPRAFAIEFVADNLRYSVNSDNATVTVLGFYSSTDALTVPATVTYGGNTYVVTAIEESAFSGCTELASVSIAPTVTSIERDAFDRTAWYNNQPDGLVYAGVVAYKYKGTMPSGTSITIRQGVKGIAGSCFEYCSGLTSVTIPNTVTTICSAAFVGCSNLASISIPSSVTSISYAAFYGTAWYDNQPDGLVYAGVVAYKYKGTMPSGTSITIQDGTKGIAGGCFEGCTGLTSITIPNSVTSIGNLAFFGCSGLTGVVLPVSITEIGYWTFRGCSGLTSITIPNAVTKIGDEHCRPQLGHHYRQICILWLQRPPLCSIGQIDFINLRSCVQ